MKRTTKMKTLALCLAVIMVMTSIALVNAFAAEGPTCVDCSYVNGFCTGCDGYEPAQQDGEGAYLIDNAGKLYWFAAFVNDGNTTANAVLTADITVNTGVLTASGTLNGDGSNFRTWTPIGNGTTQYTGTFDGQNHTVSGLYATGNDYSGLFGYTAKGSTVKKVGVEDSYFYGSNCIGGVVGRNNKGTVTACYNAGTVIGGSFAGGVVGHTAGPVTDCYNHGKVNGSTAGGVAGYIAQAAVTDCYNIGTVSGIQFVGGVAGSVNGGSVNNCYYLIDAVTTPNEYGTSVTLEYFQDGIVKANLNGGDKETLFCQKSGAAYPALHILANGMCASCDSYEQPKLVDGYYEIDNAGKLYWFAAYVNAGNTTVNGKLTADIVVNENVLKEDGTLNGDGSAFYPWTPIGSSAYAGTFDGDGHTISGLYCNQNIAGLFSSTGSTALLKNFGVVDSYFASSYHAAVICAKGNGKIENCFSSSTVESTQLAGGIAGDFDGSIANCYLSGRIYGGKYSGGIAAACGGLVENCYSVADVSGGHTNGAIVAYANAGTVENCYYLEGSSANAGRGTAMTAQDFASGQVALQLGEAYGQKVGEDGYPVFRTDDNAVYGCGPCNALVVTSEPNNPASENVEHPYVNGICPGCDLYEVPEQVDGVYQIDNAGKLYWFAQLVNSGETTANAVLTANIEVNEDVLDENGDLNGTGSAFRGWTPIGSNANQYSGTFDGQNHTVSGLYFNNATVNYVGLFGYTNSSAKVNNLGVTDSYFCGKNSVGGVVGWNIGTVEKCYNAATVSGNNNVGGVVGYNSLGTVENCYNIGAVNGNNNVGGVIGSNNAGVNGAVRSCYNIGAVNGNDKVGGVVGNQTGGTVENCYYLTDTAATDAADSWFMMEDEVQNGRMAALLGDAFGQNLNEDGSGTADPYPVFRTEASGLVYAYTNCRDEELYSNTEYANGTHDYQDNNDYTANAGFEFLICSVCGGYEEPELVDGVYQIGTASELYWFAQLVNSGETTANAVLTADIKVNEGVLKMDGTLNGDGTAFRPWTAIGYANNTLNGSPYYNGTFDGQNYTISGLYCTKYYAGLFGYAASGATIKNVGVVDSYFSGVLSGGIAGQNAGTIDCCFNSSTVIGSSAAGGFVGQKSGTVKNCYNFGKVQGRTYSGGISGSGTGLIENCYNAGVVTGGSSGCGSITAIKHDSNRVENCYYLKQVGDYTNPGGIKGADAAGKAEARTLEQFASGEVAFLLGDAFGQTISVDDYPVFRVENNANQVYTYKLCPGNEDVVKYDYANVETEDNAVHTMVNCTCVHCGITVYELVQELEQTVADLKAALEAKDEELASAIAALEAELEALKERVKNLEDTYATDEELDASIADLAAQIADLANIYATKTALQNAIDALTDLINTNKADITAINALLETINAELAKLKNAEGEYRLDVIEDTIKTLLETTIPGIEALIRQNADNIGVNAAAITTLNNTISTIQDTLAALSAEDSRLAGLIAGLDTRLTALETTLEDLKNELLAELAAAKAELEEALAELKELVDANSDDIAAMEALIATINTQLDNINRLIQQNTADIAANAGEIDALKTLVSGVQDTLAALSAEDSRLAGLISGLDTRLTALETTLEAALEDLENELLAELAAAKAELEEALAELKELVDANSDDIAAMEVLIATINTQLDNINRLIQQNTADIAANAGEIDALKTLVSGVQDTLAALAAEDSRLAGLIAGLDTRLTALETTLEDLKNELLAELAAAKAELEEAIAKLEEAMKQNADNIAALAKDVADKYAELRALINDQSEKLKNLKDYVDELHELLDRADEELAKAIEALRSELSEAVEKLEQADEANAKELADAIAALKLLIEAANAYTDEEVAKAIQAAQESLDAAVEELEQKLDAAIQELWDAINANKADVLTQIERLRTTLNAAIAANNATKIELTEQINGAKSALKSAIDELEDELKNAIIRGDETLDEKIAALQLALDTASAIANDADEALRKQMNDATTTLNLAMEKIRQDLANTKAELEAKDNELEEKDRQLNKLVITSIVIGCVGVAGCAGLVIFIIMDKRKLIK